VTLGVELARVFVPLLAAMNPLGKIPVFISLTEGADPARVRRVIHQAVFVSLAISVTFLFGGTYIFDFLRIQPADFQIGGGLILFVFAVADILNVRRPTTPGDEALGVCPLATPLIAGPAVLTTTLLVGRENPGETLVSLLVNTGIIWLTLRSAGWLMGKLGRSTLVGVSKVMMLLLAAIGVMMVRTGLMFYVKDVAASTN
jgi:multiple antibiotic resistance protein